MIYIQLFLSFLQVGALSFGGGYAAMPLIQEQVVNLHGWLSMSEFTNLITIAEMTPGPIAVNSATFVGMHYCNPACICLYEISEYVITSGYIVITSSGSCGHDRQSRSDDSDFSIFPGRNSQSYPPECMCTDDRILCDRDGTAS